jgi:hypothetical protein
LSMDETKNKLKPPFPVGSSAHRLCLACAKELSKVPEDEHAMRTIAGIRAAFLSDVRKLAPRDRALVQVIVSVLSDLRAQAWNLAIDGESVALTRPQETTDPVVERLRIRAGHLIARDRQLRTSTVRRFVLEMERRRVGPKGDWVSVFSVMRDGRELAECLRTAAQQTGQAREVLLAGTIDPYIQVVDDKAVCAETGFRLMDIWRYFRYTWASAYNSVPGRNLLVLIRDRACTHHPVMGIAALVSPVVHMSNRDDWIGWASRRFVAHLRQEPTAVWAKWVHRQLEMLLEGVFIDDFLEEGVLSRRDLTTPSEAVVERMVSLSAAAKRLHQRYPKRSLLKNPTANSADWESRAKSYLFRSKRASTLAELMRTRIRLRTAGFEKATIGGLKKALASPEGCRAIDTIRKYVKAIHVGNDVLDIAICGAVAPYNPVLGGKLVAMLMVSPEIAQAYEERYRQKPSIIASSMAGRPVYRKPRLVALTTTSLYGASLNQYTRLTIPLVELGLGPDEVVRFKNLEKTEGLGSYHLSASTVDEIEVYLSQLAEGHRVHSIFGEGVNPRMRKIRAGLDAGGFPSNCVLQHGSTRVIYAVALARNFREYLLGREKEPDYLLPHDHPGRITAAIADYWRRRWLTRRIDNPDVIAAAALHSLARPVRHGARVSLEDRIQESTLFAADDETMA